MKMTWILGLGMMLLVACGVETTAPDSPDEATVAGEVSAAPQQAVDGTALQLDQAQAVAVCTPGDSQSCCPYASGCSCNGDRECLPSGVWSRCYGAAPIGQPCP